MRKFLLSLFFAITAIAVHAQDPAIVMTTTKSINSQFSFGIDAIAPNTPIQIDWGNGVRENYTIGDVTEFFSFPLKGNYVKIWGTGIASLTASSKELTALDVTRATSLTYLYIKTNQITTLDLSNCTALTFVDCSENLLTSLTLPNTSTLTAINCDNNLLASLNVSGATGITELTCTNNKLTFSTLPIKQPTWTTYTYSPQQNISLPKQTYSTNEEIDLSSQLTAGSNTSTYVWKTASGTTLVNGTDYNAVGGKFTFLKTFTVSLYCEMTNATFPSLTLKTTSISVPPTPSVIMTTTKAVGSSFSFGIGATTNNTPIQVDWGNGTLASYTIGTSSSSVSGTITGNTIKIYGVGIYILSLSNCNLTSLDVSNNSGLTMLSCSINQLTALDLSNNTALIQLFCNSNQLTTLDLTKNAALTILKCDSNKFTFATLPIKQATWTTYTYSPQAKLTLPKTEYALNEEIDLSSQLSAGGNTTVYTWKTAGGVTLVKNVDYSENNGKFTFIKEPGDYFYCQMTNASFPDLNLLTENVFIPLTSPSFTMVTSKTIGSSFSFLASALSNNTVLKIDWGNGTLTNTTVGNTYTTINGTLSGNTIKIYGLGITRIDISDKNLTSIDAKSCLTIKELYCYNNNIGSLDVEGLNELTILHCYSNGMTNLNVKNCQKLSTLYCYYNELTSLNTNGCNSLKLLYCTGNKITSLNVSENLNLEELGCTDNKITAIDLTQNSKLKLLGCSNNLLESIDLSKNTLLWRLHLANNQLSSLNLNNNSLISRLDIPGNWLTFSLLPTKTSILTDYIYSPQRKIILPKKQYGLTETVNLSSELTIDGKTTNYTWKTKGGATLVAGTDYNVTGGVTTFLKVQTDSVYCQMTNATFPNLTLTTTNIKVSQFPLSVSEDEIAVKVYPNPATESFNLEMAEEIVRVEVYTLTGVKVFENGLYSSTKVSVPLNNIPKGALLVKVFTRNGAHKSKVVKI